MSTPLAELDPTDPAIGTVREIWELVHDPDAGFETRLERTFDVVSEALDLPYGFLTRIDRSTDTQRIEAARGSHDLLQVGESGPLSASYCRFTLASDEGLFHVDDATAEGLTDDPAYRRFGLEVYVGATTEFGGQTYGTFCFAGSERRERSLSEGEIMVVDLLARWASRELDTRSERAEFQHQSQREEDLASIVSDSLQNPLAIARGQVDLLHDSVQESIDRIEGAHQRMAHVVDNTLLISRMGGPVSDPSTVDLRDCVVGSWGVLETHDATLTMDLRDAQVTADGTYLKRLFEHLFRNCIEHGSAEGRNRADDDFEYRSPIGRPDSEDSAGDSPTDRRTEADDERDDGGPVSVEVGLLADGFYVADDGPGIPPSERSLAFDPGYSTVPERAGFGLSVVRRVADAHGWDVTITDSDAGGTRVEVTGVDLLVPE